MAWTDIVIGSLSWGSKVNDGFRGQDSRISNLEAAGASASQTGFKAIPYAPELAASSSALTAGTVTMVQVTLPNAATLSTLTVSVFAAGATLTAGQNFAALYSAAGTRVAVTADQSAAWATTGEKNMAFTSPYAAAAGLYYLALLANGTTPPTIFRTVSTPLAADVVNHGMTPANARWTTGPTGQTSMPASVVMGSRTLSGTAFWMGVS